MEQKYKACVSNIAFTCCSVGIFLLSRHRLYVTNAFRNTISPLCMSLLRYQNQHGFHHYQAYLKKATLYLAVQSSIVLLSGLYPNILSPSVNGYHIQTDKILNPVVFCLIFRIPLWVGMGLGVAANHVSGNESSKMGDFLS